MISEGLTKSVPKVAWEKKKKKRFLAMNSKRRERVRGWGKEKDQVSVRTEQIMSLYRLG